MTKIYLAENFFRSRPDYFRTRSQSHFLLKKHEIIETSITARMAKPAFEIYVDEKMWKKPLK